MSNDDRMSFSEALSKLIRKDQEGHPEYSLTIAARIEASEALRIAIDKERMRSR